MRSALPALAIAAVLIAGTAKAGEPVTGPARIVDGDTVEIGAMKLRLQGIDTPETDQICFTSTGARDPCGVRARDALITRYGEKPWSCSVSGQDKYGRSLGTCSVGGEDVQQWLVRQGLALSFVRYAHTYDADEKVAREAKVGLWAGCFAAPWEWRGRNDKTVLLGSVCPVGAQKELLSSVSAAEAPDSNCQIKGNVNRSGECIFHLPGGRHYAQVKMDQSKGKRWFCSAQEAEAAGCRASKQ